ncbi:MAG: ParA family protein, partial [Janthinobacterium lividum]
LNKKLIVSPAITIGELTKMAADAADVFEQVRDALLEPFPRKQSPHFSIPQVAALCNVNRAQFKSLVKKHSLPEGTLLDQEKSKTYTMAEAIQCVQTIGKHPSRPEDKPGKMIVVCNYKGGVNKTTTAVCLAQGLALRGLKVLLVDMDGQGSATMLSGFSPELEIEHDQTIMPYIYGEQPDLSYAVRETYWHNMDLIPGSSSLLASEFVIPAKARDQQLIKEGYQFWMELTHGLAPLREKYDAIILDTSPSLGYLTQNAMVAADGLLMPCPLDALDYASSTQFWGVFAELTETLPGFKETKTYDFVEIFLTKTKPESDLMATAVRGWIQASYGIHLGAIGIPDSIAAKSAAAQLKTIYDLQKPDGSMESYKRYKEPIDALVDHVLGQLSIAWRR